MLFKPQSGVEMYDNGRAGEFFHTVAPGVRRTFVGLKVVDSGTFSDFGVGYSDNLNLYLQTDPDALVRLRNDDGSEKRCVFGGKSENRVVKF